MQVNIFCKYQSVAACETIQKEYYLNPSQGEQLKNLGLKKENNQWYNTFIIKKSSASIVYNNFLNDKELEYY